MKAVLRHPLPKRAPLWKHHKKLSDPEVALVTFCFIHMKREVERL
ncbi:uncharacterized protein METZ01_LOCUS360167, partial [marine metagenome]